jgi:ABC-2 type transport system ATP-binding protein
VALRQKIWELVRRLNQEGTTILFTTHYLEEAEELCRNVAIIKQGEIIKNQSVKSLLANMETQTYLVTVDKISGFEGLRDFQISQFDENTLEVVVELGKSLSFLAQELNKAGMEMIEIRPKNNRLEQLYLDILNN